MPNSMFHLTKTELGSYSPPRLTIYGDVKALTASGTSGISENGNPPTCATNAARRPC